MRGVFPGGSGKAGRQERRFWISLPEISHGGRPLVQETDGLGLCPPPAPVGRAYAGSAIRASHIFLNAGRDWQVASHAVTAGNSAISVGWA